MLVANLGYGDETVNLENIFAASRAYMINIRIFMPGTVPCLIRYKPPSLLVDVETLNLSVEFKNSSFNWRLLLPKGATKDLGILYPKKVLMDGLLDRWDDQLMKNALAMVKRRTRLEAPIVKFAKWAIKMSRGTKVPNWLGYLVMATSNGFFGPFPVFESLPKDMTTDLANSSMPYKNLVTLLIELLAYFNLINFTRNEVYVKLLRSEWKSILHV